MQVTAAVVRRDTGPTHGIIYLPKKDIMVEAAKGHGCRVNGEVIDFRMGQVTLLYSLYSRRKRFFT